MDIVDLEKRLLAVARAHRTSDDVPYAFEKRVMARIAMESLVDVWAFWGRLLWRAAAPCLAIMLVFTVWSLFSTTSNSNGDNLAIALEDSVMAPLARLEESW